MTRFYKRNLVYIIVNNKITFYETKMARITKEQHAASDLLDFMHFHEVSFLMIKNNELCENINKIISKIDSVIKKNEVSSHDYTLYKHYLLFALEVILVRKKSPNFYEMCNYIEKEKYNNINKEQYEDVLDFYKDFSLEIILNYIEFKKLNTEIFEIYLNEVLDYIEKNIDDNFYASNLLIKSYFYEFNMASYKIYKKYIDLNFFTKKNVNLKIPYEYGEELFIRFLLIIEYESIKSLCRIKRNGDRKEITIIEPDENMSIEDRKKFKEECLKLIDDIIDTSDGTTSASMFLIDYINNKDDLLNFILKSSERMKRERFFVGKPARWLSIFGAFLILCLKNSTNGENIAIYSEEHHPDKTTISEIVSGLFQQKGDTLSARTLYLRFKELKVQYLKIKYYAYVMSLKEQKTINWYAEDKAYELALKFDPNNMELIDDRYGLIKIRYL